MILNSYAVLDGFVGLLRAVLALAVLGLAVIALLGWRRARQPEDRKALEDRCYLLFLLAGLLLLLDVLSWPLFYLLLQSYVAEWPGVMCVYGVSRIGTGSIGPARFLPTLVTALQTAKPVLVFLSGAWFVLYLLNRRTRTAPLTGRVLGLVLAAGLLALADAAAELTYLAIPKKEEFLSGGCCTPAFDDQASPARLLPGEWVGPEQLPWLYAAYYAVNGCMILALAAGARLCRLRLPGPSLAVLLGLALASGAVNAVFLVEAAAPRLSRLPYHHCPYDLIPRAPESLVSVGLFLAGSFAVGWGCTAAWLGGAVETRPLLPGTVGSLLRLGVVVYAGSLLLMSVDLWARRQAGDGCALDGMAIQAPYRVDVTDARGQTHSFCCLRCAEIWMGQQAKPVLAIRVTDETSGEMIDAGEAHYVHSQVVTTPTTGNRIHAFRHLADAERHARRELGGVLSGSERPFASLLPGAE